MRSALTFVCLVALAALPAVAQAPAPVAQLAEPEVRSSYVLGPDDQIIVRALDAEEISEKPVRVEMSGFIHLPLLGRVRASGLTIEQLEREIIARLRTYINEPDVAVSIVDFRSQPVSVIGSVKLPGVHQLQGRKTLVEILSLAGGLADDAGHTVKITRRIDRGAIPLPSAVTDPTGRFSVAEVSLQGIMEARNPEENIVVLPHDVVSVPRANLIYVTGNVVKSGGFILRERETLSVLQALSLAGGLEKGASPKSARILRASATDNRTEIPIDLKKILSGQAGDLPLQAEDILFVPSSATKRAALRAAEAAIQITTGLIIWRR